MNLKPFVSSKRLAALISPRLPSLMRSPRVRPWFWYCLDTETTKRRLALVSFSRAIWSPSRMRWASSTSSSIETMPTLLISCRYLSSDWLSRLVICLLILSCLMRKRYWLCGVQRGGEDSSLALRLGLMGIKPRLGGKVHSEGNGSCRWATQSAGGRRGSSSEMMSRKWLFTAGTVSTIAAPQPLI